jgi:hypothetical protein
VSRSRKGSVLRILQFAERAVIAGWWLFTSPIPAKDVTMATTESKTASAAVKDILLSNPDGLHEVIVL